LVKDFKNDWQEINKSIVNKVDRILNILEKYTINKYSPMTIDQSELESVVFGGGFVDMSTTFIEESYPKFEYGGLDKKNKNCMIAMFVDHEASKEKVDTYHTILTNHISNISSRIPNARMIPGILRGKVSESRAKDESIKDRFYITIASGLSVDKYMKKIEKLRDEAVKKAEAYADVEKSEKLVAGKETKTLDI